MYLSWYVVTLSIHALFMNYVLAGVFWQVWAAARQLGSGSLQADRLTEVVADWLPFMTGAAITAGVAPLLFVQVLYDESFYTANLLLFHRWMAMLPALIAGFYLLYLLKSRSPRGSAKSRLIIATGAAACFLFTAWSWTENHVLSLHPEQWQEQFASGAWVYRHREILPRLAMWCAGSLTSLALVTSCQLWYLAGRSTVSGVESDVRRAAHLALGGIVASAVFATWYVLALSPAARQVVLGPAGRWYLGAAAAGLVVESAAWAFLRKHATWQVRWLVTAAAGRGLTLVSVTILRECRRLAAVDIDLVSPQHAEAAQVGGWPVFIAFFVANAALVLLVLWVVRTGQVNPPRDP